jgi:hypothetical protein
MVYSTGRENGDLFCEVHQTKGFCLWSMLFKPWQPTHLGAQRKRPQVAAATFRDDAGISREGRTFRCHGPIAVSFAHPRHNAKEEHCLAVLRIWIRIILGSLIRTRIRIKVEAESGSASK